MLSLRRVAGSLDSRHYNGAVMVGLTGVVVKSHGSADDDVAFARAINVAQLAAARQLIQHVSQALAATTMPGETLA